MSRREDIDNAIWSDPDFADLSADAKLLYLWSFTNPRCGMAGLYKVSKGAMVFETTIPVDRVNLALDELEGAGFLFYDGRVVWIRSRAKHLRTRTSQIAKSIAADLRSVGEHPFVERFVEMYGGWEWLSEALMEGRSRVGRGSGEGQPTLNGGSTEGQSTLQGKGRVRAGKEVSSTSARSTTARVRELFDYWRERTGHTKAKWDPAGKRAKAVERQLRKGRTVDEIRRAIDGAATNAYEANGQVYDDLELICRDEVKLDSFIARAAGGSVDDFVDRLGTK